MGKPVLKKGDQQHPRQPLPAPPIDSEFEARFPNLYAYMTQDTWDEGGARATTTLLFFFERGELKCCVSDRELQRSAFFTGSSIPDLMEKAENALEEDTADWRQKRLAR